MKKTQSNLGHSLKAVWLEEYFGLNKQLKKTHLSPNSISCPVYDTQ